MTILLDVDGVIADFVQHACNTLASFPGCNYAPEDFKSWDLNETLSATASGHLLREMNRYGWCYRIPPYLDAALFVKDLQRLSDVVALTAPLETSCHWKQERAEALEEKFGIKNVISCPSKYKVLVCATALVEDNLKTICQWNAAWGADDHNHGLAILIDRPWNQGPTPFGVLRVSSYAEAFELLKDRF